MTPTRIAIILVSVLVFVASNTSCNTLAVSGPKKYKVTMQNHLLAITDEIHNEGLVSTRTMARYEKFITKSEAEFGGKGSYIRGKEALDELRLAVAAEQPNIAFEHNNVAKHLIKQCQDLLLTEVQD